MDIYSTDLSDQPRNLIPRHVLQICHSALHDSKGNCIYKNIIVIIQERGVFLWTQTVAMFLFSFEHIYWGHLCILHDGLIHLSVRLGFTKKTRY